MYNLIIFEFLFIYITVLPTNMYIESSDKDFNICNECMVKWYKCSTPSVHNVLTLCYYSNVYNPFNLSILNSRPDNKRYFIRLIYSCGEKSATLFF